jgi:LPXTG-motif cell wall-anchored protein
MNSDFLNSLLNNTSSLVKAFSGSNTPATPAPAVAPKASNNTLLYVGIGLAVLVLGFLFLGRRR